MLGRRLRRIREVRVNRRLTYQARPAPTPAVAPIAIARRASRDRQESEVALGMIACSEA
jgi:hypothetical protein